MISFSDNTIAIESIAGRVNFNCVLRCDYKVICFGYNLYGGLAVGDTSNHGDGPDEMTLLQPIAFDPLKITIVSTALTALTLSNGFAVPIRPCQTVYNLLVLNSSQISVSSFTTEATSGATVMVNGGPANTVVPLKLHVVNTVLVKVTVGAASTTYTLGVRRVLTTAVYAGVNHSCLLLTARFFCWGV